MITLKTASVAATLSLSAALLAAPAYAGTASLTDPAGDGSQGKRLDITSATLSNKPKAIVVTVQVDQVGSGHMIAFLKPKGLPRVIVASEYDAKEGTLDNGLFAGAGKPLPCKGISAAWSTSEDFVRLRFPAKCISDGEYDQVKFRLLSERSSGGDTDFAGGDRDEWEWSPFAPRS